jgi:cytochrome o ubiquinol oxidase subunit IV
MTEWAERRSGGDRSPGLDQTDATGSVAIYTAGLVLALLLTAASFIVARTGLLWGPGIPVGLAVLAIAQMGVHLVFFLHMSSGPDNTNNVLALAFGVLIVILVVGGSIFIMTHLNGNMMPMAVMQQMER